MKKITIIMPFLNEEEEPRLTVESIFNTAPKGLYDIIAIDDCSDKPSDLQHFKGVRYVRNPRRVGVDCSRQIGVELAKTSCIFIIDSHMRFKNDKWMEKIIECIEREPTTAWCTVCLGLDKNNMDVHKTRSKYHGADMLFVDSNATESRPAREVLEPKWAIKKNGLEYEIPCILGANYGFSKDWFQHIRGLKGLKLWGTSEPFLSMKSWLAGGTSKIRTDIEIGHKFRNNAPYATTVGYMVYNKIYLCKTILPDRLSDVLIGHLPKNRNMEVAMKMIRENEKEISESKEYYQNVFKRSIYDYCDHFEIKLPSM